MQNPSPKDSSAKIELFKFCTQFISLSNFSLLIDFLYSINPSVSNPGLISKNANLLQSA